MDLLSNKTHSYDKLGYLIIINDNHKLQDEKIQCIKIYSRKMYS